MSAGGGGGGGSSFFAPGLTPLSAATAPVDQRPRVTYTPLVSVARPTARTYRQRSRVLSKVDCGLDRCRFARRLTTRRLGPHTFIVTGLRAGKRLQIAVPYTVVRGASPKRPSGRRHA